MSLAMMDLMSRQAPAAAACQPDDPTDLASKQLLGALPTTIILVFSILTYALRIVARRRTNQKLGWDDYLMGVGLLISIEPAICMFLLLGNGFGHHLCNVSPATQSRFLKISFALQRANQPVLCCVKVSICLFYLRIFPQKPFRKWVYAVIVYTVLWAISTWIVNLTTCTPIAFFYDRTIPGGSCRNQTISGSVNAGLSVLGDIMVLLLPLPMLAKLKINMRRKLAVVGMFLLGSFGVVAGLIRLSELTRFVVTDGTYTQVYVISWTNIEQGVAVISGNLPLLGPLLRGFFGRNGDSSYAKTGRSGAYAKSGRNDEFFSQKSVGHEDSLDSRTFNDMISASRGEHDKSYTTTITAKPRLPQPHAHTFDRMSDTESQLEPPSVHDMELEDRAILVKRQVEISHEKS